MTPTYRRTRTRRAREHRPKPVAIRYECPICGADHPRIDHESTVAGQLQKPTRSDPTDGRVRVPNPLLGQLPPGLEPKHPELGR
jgi:hypothetical protein